jgi:hypothetical protein
MDEKSELSDELSQSENKTLGTQVGVPFEPNEPLHHKHAKLVLIFFSLFLFIIIGVLSYSLSQNSEEADNSAGTDQTEKFADSEEQKETGLVQSNPSDSWLEFTSIEYKVKLPDGWSFIHQDNGTLIYSCDSVIDGCYEVVQGTRATVEEVVGGTDGLQGLLVAIQPAGTSIDDVTSGYDFVEESVNGFSLYRRIQTESLPEDLIGSGLPVGTAEYIAVKLVQGGTRVAYVGYSVVPGQQNPTDDTVPEILRSFTLL